MPLASPIFSPYSIISTEVAPKFGVVIANDVGDRLRVAAEAVGDLGEVEALGDQVGDLFVEWVVRHEEMIAEAAREGKEREMNFEPIEMIGVMKEKVTIPPGNGAPGSALYSIPIRLRGVPTQEWIEVFLANWDSPPNFTPMHQPGIARVTGNILWLDGTTMEALRDTHLLTLKLCIAKANEAMPKIAEQHARENRTEDERVLNHKKQVGEIADKLDFKQEG